MDYKAIWKKEENRIIPLLCLLVLFAAVGISCEYYLDMNDDVLIRDILSGRYTGTPELLNVQMLAGLSALLAGVYRLIPGIPVFGIFLWGCQAGSLYLILTRSLNYVKSSLGKWMLAVGETLVIACLMGYHLIFVQYTITCGLLMCAAVFWFLTADVIPATGFLKRSLPAVLLTVLACNLRSEMMLMLLPFAALAGVWKWLEERPVFTRRNFGRYFGLFGLILAGMVISLGADKIAYSGSEWKEFRSLFDARTEIYDFQSAEIRNYESNREFYDSIGLSAAETELLLNYNYGVSEKTDAALLTEVAEYGRQKEGFLAHTIGEGIWLYRERLMNNRSLGFDEMPFLLIEAILAVFVLLASLRGKNGWLFVKLLMLAGGRSVIWMYLILRERVPERLSHPLYFIEIVMLGWLLLEVYAEEKKLSGQKAETVWYRKVRFPVALAAFALITAVSAVSLPKEMDRIAEEQERRAELMALDLETRAYYAEHPDSLFLANVMSTVQFFDRLFAADRELGNYDIMGGWICKSPHTEEKLRRFGYSSMEEAVFGGENVFLVKGTADSWEWLNALCQEKKMDAQPELVDVISGEMEVWKLRRK